MGLRIVRLRFQKHVGLLLGLLEVTAGDQQIGEIDSGLVIFRFQIDSLREFLIRRAPLLQLEKCLGQLVVRVAKTRVDLDRVAKLNGRLAVLAFFGVALPALEVFLFADIGIARTSDGKSGDQSGSQRKNNDVAKAHYKSPKSGALGAAEPVKVKQAADSSSLALLGMTMPFRSISRTFGVERRKRIIAEHIG